jgi:serine carboxypeptidase-like clade I
MFTMRLMQKVLALVGICAMAVQAAPSADEITSLPGWTGKLPSRQYSGYLQANSSNLHYWFVESESDPANDPVVLWLNGGPGCSSLDGFFYELGPFVIESKDNYKTTRLSLREYHWSQIANVLFIESPVGVGFSYSDDADYKCDDDRTATENLLAIQDFFSKFPEYLKSKLFLTGESYAGVYVPTLAEAILNAEAAGTYTGAKLTGIAVGNGCSGTEVGICGDGSQGTFYEWSYLIQTPFVDSALKQQVNSACNWTAAALNEKFALSAHCVGLLNQASAEISNVNLYDIYGDCVSGGCADRTMPKRGKVPAREEYSISSEDGTSRRLARIIPHGPDACIDSTAASAYLNQADVMTAIHVKDPGFCWGVCNTQPGWSYTSTRTNLPRDTYPLLVSAIEVLVYNGDWDACVPYTDGQGWTQSLGLPVKKSWHSWAYTSASGATNQVAGYATSYEVSSLKSENSAIVGAYGNSFAFITVKGGRHEVPESAPAQAKEMLTRLLNNVEF